MIWYIITQLTQHNVSFVNLLRSPPACSSGVSRGVRANWGWGRGRRGRVGLGVGSHRRREAFFADHGFDAEFSDGAAASGGAAPSRAGAAQDGVA